MLSRWEHLAPRLFGRVADAVIRHPRWFFYPQMLLAGLCVWFTIEHLEFDSSRDNLVGGDKKYHQNFLRFKKEFALPDELVVVVESEDKEKNRQFVERLGARLEAETNLFMDVVFKGDLKMLGPKALLFVPESDLAELRNTLRDYRPFLEQFSRADSLVSLFSLVNRRFGSELTRGSSVDGPGSETSAMIKALPALERILAQASDSLKRQGTPPAPGVNALFGGGEEAESQMYITFGKGRIYLVTVRALRESLNPEAIVRLRQLVSETQLEVPGLNVGITGEPVLEIDEMAQSQRDTQKATIISLAIVALIFVYGYHETGRPIKATLCLLVGLAYTMAFTTAVIGHLNLLTVTFAPILVGMAIDFGVHLISRYEEELRRGGGNVESLRTAMVFTGMGIFTGALTTAGAFLAMSATDFRGIQEMGVICGAGLVICLIPMVTLLPVLLLRGRQNVIDQRMGPALDRRERIEKLWLTRPRRVIGITMALCLAAAIPARKVYFDYNLLNMQSAGLPAVVFEKKLIASASKSVLYGAIIADSLDHALQLEAKLTNLPSVASVDLAGIDAMARYLTEDQTKKLELVSGIKREVSGIHFAPPASGPVDLPELSQTLFSLYGYVTLAMGQTEKEEPELYTQFQSLRNAIAEIKRQMVIGPSDQVAAKLASFQRALFRDVGETFLALRTQDDSARLGVEDLPQTIRQRFIGVSGRFLVQVYPKKDVWQRAEQERFVKELRAVDKNVTGTPVQLYEYTTLLKSSYQEAAGYSLLAIVILVFIHFRSLPSVILSLVPVAVGALWMIGIMGLFDVPFNPANIMTLPLIIGVGVTNGIHILNRFAEEQKPGILAKSTGKAVLVSGLTTIAGFGSLVFAQHRGIASLGFVMSIGTATCMLAGITLLPAILNLLSQRGWTVKKPSGDNAQSTAGSGGTEVKTSTVQGR